METNNPWKNDLDERIEEMKKRTPADDFIRTWRGRHNNVVWEITHHSMSPLSPNGTWCTYLKLYETGFKPEDFMKLWSEKTYERYDKRIGVGPNELLSDLQWNCGHTFYEQMQYVPHGERLIKIGDDFAHLSDTEQVPGKMSQNRAYTYEQMEAHIKGIIDELLEKLK